MQSGLESLLNVISKIAGGADVASGSLKNFLGDLLGI
jgi:hypothetical protein